MRRMTFTVPATAHGEGDLPAPIELLRPAIMWLRDHGFPAEDNELVGPSGKQPTDRTGERQSDS